MARAHVQVFTLINKFSCNWNCFSQQKVPWKTWNNDSKATLSVFYKSLAISGRSSSLIQNVASSVKSQLASWSHINLLFIEVVVTSSAIDIKSCNYFISVLIQSENQLDITIIVVSKDGYSLWAAHDDIKTVVLAYLLNQLISTLLCLFYWQTINE